MKTPFRVLVVLVLLLTLPAVVQAGTYTNIYGIWSYTTNGNGTCTINYPGYTGSGGVVTLPSTINGQPVTSIGDSAFSDGDLTTSGLTVVTIPDSVTSIGAFAFSHCSSLIIVLIPNGVTHIGDWALADCASLKAIVVGTRNSVYSDVDGVLFNQIQTTLIQYPGGITGSYTIPNSVTSIGNNAFADCTNLTSVVIGTNVAAIGAYAFDNCTSLSAIMVNAFNSVYSSGGGVLFSKSQSTLIQYPPGKAGRYTIPDGVTSIGDDAFSYCTGLTSVTIPDSVSKIGDYAFGGCYGLTSVSIGNGVTSIGNAAFSSCTGLTNVTIPDGVSKIGDYAFGGCYGLTSVSIPNSVSRIGQGAFTFCTSLTNVTIGNGVTNIGSLAFNGCSSLTSVTMASSVTSIGNSAFIGCLSLSSVYFRGNAPGVGLGVFAGIYPPTAYYLPSTTGWADFSANTGLPTAAWFLPQPLILTIPTGFGLKTNTFGFIISWATNIPVVVEACTNLANHSWSPVKTNTLTGGWCYFSDPQSTNYARRFYRIRSP